MFIVRKVAIDARLAQTLGGIGRYTRDLVKGVGTFGKKFKYYAIVYDNQETSWIPKSITTIPLNYSIKKLPFIGKHLIYPKQLSAFGFDLVHFPHTNAPLFFSNKFIATVHDLSIYSHPEWFASRQWLSTKLVTPRNIEKASRLIAVSEDVKRIIIKLFGVYQSKIDVVSNGVDLDLFKPVKNPSRDYLLFVGSNAPYKNIKLLNKIVKRVGMRCVVVGATKEDFAKVIDEEKVASEFEFVGRLDYQDPKLVKLYQNAYCLLQPSLYESFALPILEALSCNTPVVASNIPSLTSIYSGYVTFASLENIDDWVNKVQSIKNLVTNWEKVNEFVKRFSWENLVSRLEGVYEKSMS